MPEHQLRLSRLCQSIPAYSRAGQQENARHALARHRASEERVRVRRYGEPVVEEIEQRYYHERGEAWLARSGAGHLYVMWLPDGESTGSEVRVGDEDPWPDFERQVELKAATWEPVRRVKPHAA